MSGGAIKIGKRKVRLEGTVTPDGSATAWFFQYRRRSARIWERSRVEFAGSGGAAVNVSAVLKRLSPGAHYRYRLVAVNPGGRANGRMRGFVTKPNRR
jgi:hypothetical protein